MSDNPPGGTPEDGAALNPPRLTWQERLDARLSIGVPLDPKVEPVPGIAAYETRYLPDRLLITQPDRIDELRDQLQAAASEFGWSVRENQTVADAEDAGAVRSLEGDLQVPIPVDRHPEVVRRVEIFRDPKSGRDDQPVPPVDAWRVLQRARARLIAPDAESGERSAADEGVKAPRARRTPPTPEELDETLAAIEGVGLDHVMHLGPYPRTNPYARTNPYPRTNPHANGPGADTYAEPGSGGRQVATYIGAGPARTVAIAKEGRRPVVAILDTGCAKTHPWLKGIVKSVEDLKPPQKFGITDPKTDPEAHGDVLGPYDGYLDGAVGHGTFIAGIVRQLCPEADIVAVRVADSEGTVIESELIEALTGLLDWVEGGSDRHVDVINLSLGYYHETPVRTLFDRTLSDLLTRARKAGIAVVCSAGNDSTDRPSFPAALWAWDGADFTLEGAGTGAPHVSVGALNPNGSMALFSNLGPWVRTYAPGAAILSTFPEIDGDVQPGTRDTEWGVLRETIDPDDFRGGFAVWSGTSFAAPYVAGRLAASLVDELSKDVVTPARRVKLLSAELTKTIGATAALGPTAVASPTA